VVAARSAAWDAADSSVKIVLLLADTWLTERAIRHELGNVCAYVSDNRQLSHPAQSDNDDLSAEQHQRQLCLTFLFDLDATKRPTPVHTAQS
jgi:hypothetical protein